MKEVNIRPIASAFPRNKRGLLFVSSAGGTTKCLATVRAAWPHCYGRRILSCSWKGTYSLERKCSLECKVTVSRLSEDTTTQIVARVWGEIMEWKRDAIFLGQKIAHRTERQVEVPVFPLEKLVGAQWHWESNLVYLPHQPQIL